jgi:hypothetical protein
MQMAAETDERTQIVEQITTKIAAGDADGATYLALVVMTEVLPVLEKIEGHLEKVVAASVLGMETPMMLGGLNQEDLRRYQEVLK